MLPVLVPICRSELPRKWEAGAEKEAVVFGGQGDTAERLARASRADRFEVVELAVGCQLGGADQIGYFHQLVGVSAVVAVVADRGRDGVDCRR